VKEQARFVFDAGEGDVGGQTRLRERSIVDRRFVVWNTCEIRANDFYSGDEGQPNFLPKW
jgi:hypothetical protein